MSTILDLSGLDKRLQQLRTLDNPNVALNARPLMYTWAKIIDEDNRRGVLAGTDKDGIAMKPVTYRPKQTLTGLKEAVKFAKVSGASRNVVTKAQNRVKFHQKVEKEVRSGLPKNTKVGPYSGGIHGNLTTAQYQLLGGPPLAPRDQFSRVITNLKVTQGGPPEGSPNWFAQGAWDEVVSMDGTPFLKYHFEGIGQKKRDLRGVRPQGIAKALDALRNWAKDAVRTLFS